MKQFLVHVMLDWEDWVEAETEEEAIDQIYDDLGNLECDIRIEDVEECEDED